MDIKSVLFSTFNIRGTVFQNRIVMSPMCMYSCLNKDGVVTPWHITHYASRAGGGVGLVMVEATGVLPEGRITHECLGIWSDDHIGGLRALADQCRTTGAKIGIQLAHAGRKSMVDGRIVAPSAIAFDDDSRTPDAMSADDIKEVVSAFQAAARRAREAAFDVIEIHSAHGYLLNEFLSPLTNRREDAYGGDRDGRLRLLGEVITAIRSEWEGSLFVRLSLDEYVLGGNTMEDFIYYVQRMKELGVDLIDSSTGGVVPARIRTYPGYQVPYAETIRKEADIPVGAVGLISDPSFAEHLVRTGRADLVLLGRELLRNPYWPLHAAKALRVEPKTPRQYERSWL